jgi:hypothetical protein
MAAPFPRRVLGILANAENAFFDLCIEDREQRAGLAHRLFHEHALAQTRGDLGALEALEADASHTAHVGDLLRTDVAGARGVGMASIRIRAVYDDPSEQPEADLLADSHFQLREIFERALGCSARFRKFRRFRERVRPLDAVWG